MKKEQLADMQAVNYWDKALQQQGFLREHYVTQLIDYLGFLNYLQSTSNDGVGGKLENFVYQALIQSGYRCYVGNIYQLEVDFVAEKNNQILYIQVTYILHG